MRDVRLELGALNVVTGANGSGKSSLYRALRLLADIAQGRIIQSLAAEGGLESTLWAGPETISRSMKQGLHPIEGTGRNGPISLRLGFSSADYGYAVDLGLPQRRPGTSTKFLRDPEIKVESLWTGEKLTRASEFARRRGPSVTIRGDDDGAWRAVPGDLAPVDSMMTHANDPRDGWELLQMRERMRGWRFYGHFRTDGDAPARRRQVGTYTPVLAGDGADLAAAVQTIAEIGNGDALDAVIDDAFPGARVEVVATDGSFELHMGQPGLLRPLRMPELSDGTLRYLLLVAALLSPRPPGLMVLDEPESSLHPDLLAPLARLIARAAEQAQVIVVSHSPALVAALGTVPGSRRILLEKQFGETIVSDDDPPAWAWPSR